MKLNQNDRENLHRMHQTESKLKETMVGSDVPYTEAGRREHSIYGIIGEAGEIVDLVKKHKWQGHELDVHEVALELGDLFWYGSLLASAIGYELGTVMQMNEEKLRERYPEGFSKDRSINRKE